MGTQRVQMKGVFSWLVRWACRDCTRDFCSALAALVSPVQNIFSPSEHYFGFFVLIAQQGRQAAVLGRLSHSVSGYHICSLCINTSKMSKTGLRAGH